MMCITTWAQEKILRIPYAAGKSIHGIISEPSDYNTKHGIAIISHGFNGTHHFGRDYFNTLNEKPFKTIDKYKGPVLIIHGTNDRIVPLDYSRRAQSIYRNAELKIINKAGHGFKLEERILSNLYVKDFLPK